MAWTRWTANGLSRARNSDSRAEQELLPRGRDGDRQPLGPRAGLVHGLQGPDERDQPAREAVGPRRQADLERPDLVRPRTGQRHARHHPDVLIPLPLGVPEEAHLHAPRRRVEVPADRPLDRLPGQEGGHAVARLDPHPLHQTPPPGCTTTSYSSWVSGQRGSSHWALRVQTI